jgi:hypothetical protein
MLGPVLSQASFRANLAHVCGIQGSLEGAERVLEELCMSPFAAFDLMLRIERLTGVVVDLSPIVDDGRRDDLTVNELYVRYCGAVASR